MYIYIKGEQRHCIFTTFAFELNIHDKILRNIHIYNIVIEKLFSMSLFIIKRLTDKFDCCCYVELNLLIVRLVSMKL